MHCTANIFPLQSKGFPCVHFVPCNLHVHSKGIPFLPCKVHVYTKGIPCKWEKYLTIRGDPFFYNRFSLCRVKDIPVSTLYPVIPCKYLQCIYSFDRVAFCIRHVTEYKLGSNPLVIKYPWLAFMVSFAAVNEEQRNFLVISLLAALPKK